MRNNCNDITTVTMITMHTNRFMAPVQAAAAASCNFPVLWCIWLLTASSLLHTRVVSSRGRCSVSTADWSWTTVLCRWVLHDLGLWSLRLTRCFPPALNITVILTTVLHVHMRLTKTFHILINTIPQCLPQMSTWYNWCCKRLALDL